MNKWGFLFIGILAGIACGAHGDFPYHFYNLSMPKDCYNQGQLLGKLGKNGWKDLPLSTCTPDETGNKMKCTVAMTPDFYAAKGDYLKFESDLSACQRNLSACQRNCK